MNEDRIEYNIHRLNQLAHSALAEDNWDCGSSNSICPEVIEKARNILFMTPPLSCEIEQLIFPSSNNSIQFEYYNSNKDYMEIEVCEDAIFFIERIDGKYGDEKIISEKEIPDIIRKFYGEEF